SGLERLQAWHRHTQLPAYVDILRRLQDRMPGNLSPAQACQTYADVRSRLVAVSAELEPTAAAVAATVNASQLRHMEKRFAKSNAEFREDFLDGSARELRERRLKKALKRAEMLYGDLQDAQKAALTQAIDQSPFNAAQSPDRAVLPGLCRAAQHHHAGAAQQGRRNPARLRRRFSNPHRHRKAT
ncbi:MAG: hypothetical protein B7X59_15615, partial [Polaromonas sp. 39-63-203]